MAMTNIILHLVNFFVSFGGSLFLILILQFTNILAGKDDVKLITTYLEIAAEIISIITRLLLGLLLTKLDDVLILILVPLSLRLLSSFSALLISKLNLKSIGFLFFIKLLEKSSATSWGFLREKINLQYYSNNLTQLNYSRSTGVIISGFYYYLVVKTTPDKALLVCSNTLIFCSLLSIFLIGILYYFYPTKKNRKNDIIIIAEKEHVPWYLLIFSLYITKKFIFFSILFVCCTLLKISESLLCVFFKQEMPGGGGYDIFFYTLTNLGIIIITFFKDKYKYFTGTDLTVKQILQMNLLGLIYGYFFMLLATLISNSSLIYLLHYHIFILNSFIGFSLIRFSTQLIVPLVLKKKFSDLPQGSGLALLLIIQGLSSVLANYILYHVFIKYGLKILLSSLIFCSLIMYLIIWRYYK